MRNTLVKFIKDIGDYFDEGDLCKPCSNKGDLSEEDKIQVVKNYVSAKEGAEYVYVCTENLDVIRALNSLELEAINYEVILEDFNCDLQVDNFLDAFWKTIESNDTAIINPLLDDLDNDVDRFIRIYTDNTNEDISELSCEIENIFIWLEELINERCFYGRLGDFVPNETILDFDDFTII